ncbi:shikimate kinase [Glutamicibacter uratoxydans]|uniref:shikimate kinase n=1 Tax=Glutamicibacter uratoxydans TaxID=43667 RepID=UPI003D6E7868
MIYLIGPMACGKSTVGRSLAKALDTTFLDTDEVIVMSHGSIPEIFAAHGEARFRELEVETIRATQAGVLATGGGAVLREENQQMLRRGTVIYLQMDEQTATKRLAGGQGRPLLAGVDVLTRWKELYAQRKDIYEQLADFTVKVDDQEVSELVRIIKDYVISNTR